MEYLKLSDFCLLHSRDAKLLNFTDLVLDPDNPTKETPLLKRIPDDLKTLDPQLIILGKVRYFEVTYNHGPYIPELDTHLKSIKALIGRGFLETKEKRLHITNKGCDVLRTYIKQHSYYILRDKARFEEKLIDQGKLKSSDLTDSATAILGSTSAPVYMQDHENRLVVILGILFSLRTLGEIKEATRETDAEEAIKSLIIGNKSLIEKAIKRLKLIGVQATFNKNRLHADIQIIWYLFPNRARIITHYSTTF